MPRRIRMPYVTRGLLTGLLVRCSVRGCDVKCAVTQIWRAAAPYKAHHFCSSFETPSKAVAPGAFDRSASPVAGTPLGRGLFLRTAIVVGRQNQRFYGGDSNQDNAVGTSPVVGARWPVNQSISRS
jgi:hypothetical protein